MALDPVILDKIEENRFILGMSAFSIGVVFNVATFIALITTGLVKQSTGFYVLFMTIADTIALICGVLMEEFYNPLVDVDVFAESGDPVTLCQAMYFFREMCYYWRWLLLAIIVIDRCLLMVSKTSTSGLRISAVLFILGGFGASAALAGYWIYWVNNKFIPGEYVAKTCKFTWTPHEDTSSTWFYMEAIVHLLYPDVILLLIVMFSANAMCSLYGKAADHLEEEDFNLCKIIVALAFVNVSITIPYLVVNGILLYIDKIFDVYGFSATTLDNLTYASRITEKFKEFNLCITFFVLLFSSQFRSAFCRNTNVN